MYGMGDVARNGGEWRRLGYSAAVSPFAAIFANPRLYVEKVGEYFVVSIYNFAQELQPVLMVLLGFGLWSRGRAILGELKEAFLAAVESADTIGAPLAGAVRPLLGFRVAHHTLLLAWVVTDSAIRYLLIRAYQKNGMADRAAIHAEIMRTQENAAGNKAKD